MTTLKNDEIMSRLKTILVEELKVDEADITLESSYAEDLGADSIDIISLLMLLEEEFDCQIPDEEAVKLTTVSATVDYIRNRMLPQRGET